VADGTRSYQAGNLGDNAIVQQGENLYLYQITVHVQNEKDADALLHRLKAERDAGLRYDLLLRRLDPLVLVNRKEKLKEIEQFFADLDARVLYVTGLPGIGKSTLVRGALEFRRADTHTLWITCEGLDADQLLNEMNVGLHLEVHALLKDTSARLAQRIAVVLGAIVQPSILVLDGFEALLDENGKYASQGMAAIIEALTQLEHKAKVLVSTRRVPPDVGAGSPGIRLLRLGGLSPTMAEGLFRNRTQQTVSKGETALSMGALQKLDGHPKFIELLATAIADLPVEQVTSGLLTASDIGEYVIGQVLGQLGPLELQVLRAAIVFRAVFSFEALHSVFDAIDTEREPIDATARKLVRRAVLEPVDKPQTGYYVHPLLRDAVPREAASEAVAHTAAASWFLREPIEWENSKTWDDGLYHLRRAAEVGRSEAHFRLYFDFIMENGQQMNYAGWGRRFIAECSTLLSLAEDGSDWFIIAWAWGNQLWVLNEYEEAVEVFREVDRVYTQSQQSALTPDMTASSSRVDDLGVKIKIKLALSLLKCGHIGEAQRIVNEMDQVTDTITDIFVKEGLAELHFEIAREVPDVPEMLRWATTTLQLAEQEVQEAPSLAAWDGVAEAHFQLGVCYLRLDNHSKMFEHFVAQLRIKLDIGKISGVAAGLYNLGMLADLRPRYAENISEPLDALLAGALLLLSEQIRLEVGVPTEPYSEKAEAYIQEFLKDQSNIERERETLATISHKLLPFYQRAIERRRDNIPPLA
jgi:tetratricopeptide (TPR) repeat protein